MLTLKTAIANRLKMAVALLALSGAAGAQDATRALQAVDFTALDSDRVQLTLTLSEPAPEPVVFTIDKPARLSLDLPATRLALAERYRKVGIGNVTSLASVEAKGRTRVVVELVQSAPYKVRTEGNQIIVQLDGAGVTAAAAAPSSLAASGTGGSIRNIDFRRGEKGEGRVVVRLADAKTTVDVREESGKVRAVFRNTDLPENLRRRLDVLDFATPVKFVDVQRIGINTEIVVTPVAGAQFEQAAYQAGDVFTLELQPFTEEKIAEKKKEPQYTGERISLSFQNVDIRSLLQIVADVAGTNMVISDSVQGSIAMRLQNVPWDQALDIILKTKGLAMRRDGNVMLVAPAGEIAKREREELEAEKSKLELAPLRSELIQVNYAKASDMKALLASENASLLSERGRVSVDERTNTLLVLETRDRIAEIRELIGRLDIPVRQVLIESRIVIANDDFAREMGVKFGVSTIGQSGGTQIGQSGNNSGSRDIINGAIPGLEDSYAVNLPTAGTPAGSIGWTILGSDFLVDLELSALQSEGRGEVIS
ncbi:MAG TPA: type IV pilus secretin PilQ, partial [Solimonas sp.]|nr:type IV pilus secretin PilQ [Solimonas sp.]